MIIAELIVDLQIELQKHSSDMPVRAMREGQLIEFKSEHITEKDGYLIIDLEEKEKDK